MSKQVQGVVKTFHYRGFEGSAEVSIEDKCLHGKILGISDLVTYEGDTVQELEDAFHFMADEYLADRAKTKNELPPSAKILKEQAAKVIKLIREIPLDLSGAADFTPYENMTATLAEAVLQAGMNYETVVVPKIQDILESYSDSRTTNDVLILLQTHPVEEILQCKNKRKQEAFIALADTLHNEDVETETDLAVWISDSSNERLLFDIHGVADKTIDYLKKLCGLQAIAIDRHMFHFLEMAGIETDDYDKAHDILKEVATELGVGESALDSAIWNYMSDSKNEKREAHTQ